MMVSALYRSLCLLIAALAVTSAQSCGPFVCSCPVGHVATAQPAADGCHDCLCLDPIEWAESQTFRGRQPYADGSVSVRRRRTDCEFPVCTCSADEYVIFFMDVTHCLACACRPDNTAGQVSSTTAQNRPSTATTTTTTRSTTTTTTTRSTTTTTTTRSTTTTTTTRSTTTTATTTRSTTTTTTTRSTTTTTTTTAATRPTTTSVRTRPTTTTTTTSSKMCPVPTCICDEGEVAKLVRGPDGCPQCACLPDPSATTSTTTTVTTTTTTSSKMCPVPTCICDEGEVAKLVKGPDGCPQCACLPDPSATAQPTRPPTSTTAATRRSTSTTTPWTAPGGTCAPTRRCRCKPGSHAVTYLDRFGCPQCECISDAVSTTQRAPPTTKLVVTTTRRTTAAPSSTRTPYQQPSWCSSYRPCRCKPGSFSYDVIDRSGCMFCECRYIGGDYNLEDGNTGDADTGGEGTSASASAQWPVFIGIAVAVVCAVAGIVVVVAARRRQQQQRTNRKDLASQLMFDDTVFFEENNQLYSDLASGRPVSLMPSTLAASAALDWDVPSVADTDDCSSVSLSSSSASDSSPSQCDAGCAL